MTNNIYKSPEKKIKGRMSRDLGLISVIAISMSAMIGGGLFVLPGPASALTGPSLFLAYLLACILVLPAALAKSELSTAIPVSGGSYIYVDRVMGPWVGTIAGLGLWISLLLKTSFALISAAAYLELIFDISRINISLILLLIIGILNIIGVKWVGRIQTITIIIVVSFIMFLNIESVEHINPERFKGFFQGGLKGIITAAGIVFISFAGVTKVAAVAEEVKNPGKILPLGILISLSAVAIIYVFTSFALINTIGAEILSKSINPIDIFARNLFGNTGRYFAVFVALLTLTGMANAGLLASARFPFAMARDNMLPQNLGRINKKTSTPVRSIIISVLFCAVSLIFFDIVSIAKLASAFVIFIFILVMISLMIFRESGTGWYRPVFKMQGYPIIIIAGIIGQTILLILLGTKAVIGIGFSILLGSIWYFLWCRKRVTRLGILEQAGPRKKLYHSEKNYYRGNPTGDKNTVVSIFGNEISPELMIIIGDSITDKGSMEILHLEAIPDIRELAAITDRDILIKSFFRRINNAEVLINKNYNYDVLYSRDIRKTLYEYVLESHCSWLVMEWHSNIPGSAFMGNRFAWLFKHIPCNLALYRDTGFRVIKNILVRPVLGPHDALIINTAFKLAKHFNASITFIINVEDNGLISSKQAAADYIDELAHLCGLPYKVKIITNKNYVNDIIQETSNNDLMILGAPSENPVLYSFRIFRPVEEKIIEASYCSVLLLKSSSVKHYAENELFLDEKKYEKSVIYALNNTIFKTDIDVQSKKDLFKNLAQEFSAKFSGIDPEIIKTAFEQRESIQNTAVENGIAMPHATINEIDKTYLGIFIMKEPVDYEVADNEKIEICMATVGPSADRVTHLYLLSILAKIGIKNDYCKEIKSALTNEELKKVFNNIVNKL